MPATVTVNNLTVVHAASNGVSFIFPDVCKTPTPAGPIPIPYPNIAQSTDTAMGSKTLTADGNPIMLKSSFFALSTGDEAGAALGVVSNMIKGKAYPKSYSMDVKVEGENVFRLTDIMLQNGGSPTNTPPGTEVQPPIPPTAGTDPEIPKVTSLKWNPAECCCGDVVALEVETKDFADGWAVPIALQRNTDTFVLSGAMLPVVTGNKSSARWAIRRGPYAKDVKITAKAHALGGLLDSSNQLTVKTAPDAVELIGPVERQTPKYVEQNVPGVGKVWVPAGTNYGWDMCYQIYISQGQLVVKKKIDFDLQPGASPSEKKKTGWKREIERIWDLKWKLHRTKCDRGDNCSDSYAWGCCSYPIRIVCEWGAGHGKKVKLFAGANDPNGWGSGKWWYSHTWWEDQAGVPATVRAHEFGHLVGMYDEYPAGACDPGRVVTNDPTSIMNSGSNVYARHMKDFHDWFDKQAKGVVGDTKLLST